MLSLYTEFQPYAMPRTSQQICVEVGVVVLWWWCYSHVWFVVKIEKSLYFTLISEWLVTTVFSVINQKNWENTSTGWPVAFNFIWLQLTHCISHIHLLHWFFHPRPLSPWHTGQVWFIFWPMKTSKWIFQSSIISSAPFYHYIDTYKLERL